MKMPPKTIKRAIKDTLENLGKENLDKFRSALLDRREEPRVALSRVEHKDFLVITDVLVSTFCEPGAARVTLELLKEIKCFDNAKALESVLEESGLLPDPQTSTGRPSATVKMEENDTFKDEHFVDKHRCALINSVNSVAQILDELLDKRVINQEGYEKIRRLSTPQDQIRELYCSGLKGGKACKDIFFKSLEKNEPFLMDELKKAK